MLTNAAVKAARPRPAAYKLADERGLHLFVTPGGRKTFRWRFSLPGRGEQLLTIGAWPEVSLDQARERAQLARAQLGRGEDPRAAPAADQERARAFEYVARRWHDHMRPRWSAVHAHDVLASLEREVFPAIGAMPLAAITVPVVLSALRVVEQQDKLATAQRVRQRISAVFGFAISEGLAEHDPAARLGRALRPAPPARGKLALLDIADARALLAAVDQLGAAPAIVAASRFLALTAVRLAVVLGARWSEIEDLDGPAPLWRVPAARMKLAVAKKGDGRNDHLVPLAPAAVELLRAARAGSVEKGYNTPSPDALIFPGRGGTAPIGEASIGALYKRAGFGDRHVPHGWRSTFSTYLNEAGHEDALIERALAHSIKDKVKAAYDRSIQRSVRLAQLRALFAAWADALVG